MQVEELFALSDTEIRAFLGDVSAETVEEYMLLLQNHVDGLNAKRGVVAEVYNQKLSAAAAQRKIEFMSDDEKAALVQAIQTQGVSGQRPVGNQ